MTMKTVSEIMTSNSWKDAGVAKSVNNVRRCQSYLGFSQNWITEYVYNIVMLAKKEPQQTDDDLSLK